MQIVAYFLLSSSPLFLLQKARKNALLRQGVSLSADSDQGSAFGIRNFLEKKLSKTFFAFFNLTFAKTSERG